MAQYEPYDTERNQVRQAVEEKRRLALEQEDEDLRWLMSTKQGRRVMHMFLTTSRMFQSSYTGDNGTFFREGMRNVGLILTARLHTLTASEYLLMLEEAQHAPSDGD